MRLRTRPPLLTYLLTMHLKVLVLSAAFWDCPIRAPSAESAHHRRVARYKDRLVSDPTRSPLSRVAS